MPAARIGPVVFQVAGDAFVINAQIAAIIWEGTTVAGDRVILKHRVSGRTLWEGQTDTTNTYLGMTIPPQGHSAPDGFYAERLDNGKVLIYLVER